MTVKITAATAAATYPASGSFVVPPGEEWMFVGYGFSGADVITAQVATVNSATHVDYYKDGTIVTLSATNNAVKIIGPFVGRWSKGVTGGTVGMSLYRGNQDNV